LLHLRSNLRVVCRNLVIELEKVVAAYENVAVDYEGSVPLHLIFDCLGLVLPLGVLVRFVDNARGSLPAFIFRSTTNQAQRVFFEVSLLPLGFGCGRSVNARETVAALTFFMYRVASGNGEHQHHN